MNGEIVREQIKDGLFSATSQIAGLASDDRQGRRGRLPGRPDPPAHRGGIGPLRGRLAGTSGDERKHRLSDLYWTLLNATEFSWNH